MLVYKHNHHYVAHSYMGLNYTYDSPCWIVYAFHSITERQLWIADCEYNDQGNKVAEIISKKEACKISHGLYKVDPEKAWRVIHL